MFLASSSPDMNPMEEALIIKHLVRKVGTRVREELAEAIAEP